MANPNYNPAPFLRRWPVGSNDTERNFPGCDGRRRGSRRRSLAIGGARRSYLSGCRFYFRPGRQYINEEAEDYLVMMSSKYRIFDRHGPNGRGNLLKEGYGSWNWESLEEERAEENVTPNCIPSRAVIKLQDYEKFFDDDEISVIEEDESDDEEMTLDKYERLMEEKKKAFQAMLLGLNESAQKTDNMEEFEDYVMV